MRTRWRGHMEQAERAKQFMPFSALKGLGEQLKEAETVKETRRELLEDEAEELNRLLSEMKQGDMAAVRYHDGNRYVTERGRVNKIDPVSGRLRINEKMIPIADIGNITLDK